MIADTIIFGSHTSEEYGLKIRNVDVSSPSPQTVTSVIPGRDSPLDFTEVLGGIHYDNATLTISAYNFEDGELLVKQEKDCRNDLHGRRMSISLDTDPDYYYMGRCEVEWNTNGNVDIVTIKITCEPYKYKNELTVAEYNITDELDIVLANSRMPANPVITVDASMQLTFDAHVYQLTAGTHTLLPLLLQEGDNKINITGTGHIKFEWQEGALV